MSRSSLASPDALARLLLPLRCAIVPSSVEKLVKKGFNVRVAAGVGDGSGFSDAMYAKAGATITSNKGALSANIVIRISVPDGQDIVNMKDGATLFSLIQPRQNADKVEKLAAKNMTVFGLDCIPRTISRAQAFDVLSSQANIAGYRWDNQPEGAIVTNACPTSAASVVGP